MPEQSPARSQAQPGGSPVAPPEPPLHPALVPRGEAVAWSALGSLLAGPVVYGGLGLIVDRIFGTGRLFLALGAVAGALLGFWIVYVRFGREDGS